MKKLLLIVLCLVSSLNANIKEDMLKQRTCKVLYSLFGWCSEEKALSFTDLVLEVKPEVCVEIGVFGGSSFYPVAAALKYLGKGKIIGIDPWDKLECIKYFDPIEDKANLAWWGVVNFNDICGAYFYMISKYGLENYTMTLKTTSEKAIDQISKIDILYIDGNHAEAMMAQDVSLYLPKVRQGGYIWINDTLWPTTQKAVELLSASCDVVKLIDNGNCILFKKR